MISQKAFKSLLLLLLLSLGLNAGLAVGINKLWWQVAEAEGHDDEGRAFAKELPDPLVYQIHKTSDGEAHIYCLNGADATIRPTGTFGEMIVSCGTRELEQ